MSKETVLEVKGLTKQFDTVLAVDRLSVAFKKGEVHCVVGENGSGKSTLASMISGSLKPTAGEMFLDGKPYSPKTMLDARQNGISILVQEQGTIDGLSIAENIFLGRETSFSKSGKVVNRSRMITEAKKVLEEIQMGNLDPAANISTISFEDRKLIEVAISLADEPRILILDETTTALSHKGRDIIYQIIGRMREEGKTIIFISHDLDEVKEYADTVTVMRDGAYVTTLTREEGTITVDNIRRNMIGRDLEGKYYRTDEQETAGEQTVLKANKLQLKDILKGITFDLKEGEILGIGGLTDSGMHEIGQALFGAVILDSGSVTVMPSGKKISNTTDAARNGIAYLSKNRDKESLMMNASVKDNVALASADKLAKKTFISPRKLKALSKEFATKLEVKMSSLNQSVGELSGGNKQKVVVAKWLANDSRIMIMDCPTRGIDVGVKATIYRIMERLKADGVAIVMISEELTELIGMSDRILIIKKGQVTAQYKRSEKPTEHDIIQYMI